MGETLHRRITDRAERKTGRTAVWHKHCLKRDRELGSQYSISKVTLSSLSLRGATEMAALLFVLTFLEKLIGRRMIENDAAAVSPIYLKAGPGMPDPSRATQLEFVKRR